jgi:hypothetical protein
LNAIGLDPLSVIIIEASLTLLLAAQTPSFPYHALTICSEQGMLSQPAGPSHAFSFAISYCLPIEHLFVSSSP